MTQSLMLSTSRLFPTSTQQRIERIYLSIESNSKVFTRQARGPPGASCDTLRSWLKSSLLGFKDKVCNKKIGAPSGSLPYGLNKRMCHLEHGRGSAPQVQTGVSTPNHCPGREKGGPRPYIICVAPAEGKQFGVRCWGRPRLALLRGGAESDVFFLIKIEALYAWQAALL